MASPIAATSMKTPIAMAPRPPAVPGSEASCAQTAPTAVKNRIDAASTSPSRAEPDASMPVATSPAKATTPTATPAPPTTASAARSWSPRVIRPASSSSSRPACSAERV
ncbi:MAG: hypothetical protein QM804_13325 [Propionicimonas sp.]